MNAGKYVSMMQTVPEVDIVSPFYPNSTVAVPLPDGAVGVLYVWKTKTAARKHHGRNVVIQEIQETVQ